MKPLARFGQKAGTVMHSIRFRLVMWFALILILMLAAFSTFIYLDQLQSVRGETLVRMEIRLAQILRFTSLSTSQVVLPENVLQQGEILVLVGQDGKVAAYFGGVTKQEADAISSRVIPVQGSSSNVQLVFWDNDSLSAQTLAFISVPVHDPLGILQTAILGDPFDSYDLLGKLLLTLIGGSLAALIIALGGGFWLADRAMHPVKLITHTAREISETDLSRRLNLKSQDELGELACTFDDMLARIEAAFERQRQFVADASHELRTPLTIVNLEATQALESRQTAGEYERTLAVIRAENDFMSQLVNDLLTLARLDAGQSVVKKEALDLSDLALEAVERFEGLAARRNVRLETGELPELLLQSDRQMLLQIISNLIENAIKYAGEVEPHVRVETGMKGQQAWLRVSDNGRGISAEHLSHIFDRFYRVDKVRNQQDPLAEAGEPGGTGLGLSIVQSLCQALGGRVEVTSALGSGTRFTILLPMS
jgi:signal transduction histidine kinase